MKKKCIAVLTSLVLLVPLISNAVLIGHYPGLKKLIDSADAIVILRIDRHLSGFGSPTFYSTHECFIYQTIKGDIPKNTRIRLQLMNTEGSFATPYAHGSTHLMFLMKKTAENEPTDYRTLTSKGAQILLSPLGHEKAPEGKTIEQKVKKLIKNAIAYQAKEHEKRQKFLETVLGKEVVPRPVGKLGHPIVTYLCIEGVREPHKNPSLYRIHRVNGQPLTKPALIWIENLALPRPAPSVWCVVNGYERIEWMGEPGEVSRAEGRIGTQMSFQAVWLFHASSIIQPRSLSIR